MLLSSGTRLGAYEIVSALGAGGMGEVYRARDPRLGREVAVKVLPPSFADHADRLRRFEQEARAAGALNHPNLLTVFDVGTHEQQPFIVSELLEGQTLRERLLNGAIPPRKSIELALQIAAGVAAAHEKGIVHRDLKPENIFITTDERVKLLDFGLAKVLDDETDSAPDAPTVQLVTDAGTVLGTAGYMSPEQIEGTQLDARTDIFSFGVVLFEMLTGLSPFRRETRMATLNATLAEDPPFPAGFSSQLERVARHALEKKPSQRFQTMRDVAFALDTFSATSETAATKTKAREKKAAPPKPQEFQKLTFRRGFIMNARFARDGSVIYGAAWEDQPLEIYAVTVGDPHSRHLRLPVGDVLAISPSTGELAISLDRRFVAGWVSSGTLARSPMAGGAPREICERVQDAEWGPDGKNFIIIRRSGDVFTIEYPIGTRVYESAHWLSHVRLSPKGDRLAFLEHPLWGDDAGRVTVIDFQGNVTAQGTLWPSTAGIAWTPKGDEVWTAGGSGHGMRALVALSLSGKHRTVLAAPGYLSLYDIAPNGDVLVSYDHGIREIVAGRRGHEERNLSWFDWSFATGISHDATRIVFEEQRAHGGDRNGIYVRPIDGSPAIYLGDGRVRGFSPDDKWLLTMLGPDQWEMLPVGTGLPRRVACHGLEECTWWYWFPDGKRVLLWANAPSHGTRMYELAIDGDGTPRPIGPRDVVWPLAIAPDGERVAAALADEMLYIHSLVRDEPPLPVRGARTGDHVVTWGSDNALYVYRFARTHALIERIDLATGERTPWHELKPVDPAGVNNIHPVYLAPDLETYAFGHRRLLSELYLARNLIS